MARAGDKLARLALRATGNLPRLLSASQLGITVASLALGALAEDTLGTSLTGWLDTLPFSLRLAVRVAVASALAITIVTYLHVVFGELAPRSVALAHPERFARYLAPALITFETVVRPFTILLNSSAELVLRVVGQRPQSLEESVHSPDELRILVEQSEEGGVLEA